MLTARPLKQGILRSVVELEAQADVRNEGECVVLVAIASSSTAVVARSRWSLSLEL